MDSEDSPHDLVELLYLAVELPEDEDALERLRLILHEKSEDLLGFILYLVGRIFWEDDQGQAVAQRLPLFERYLKRCRLSHANQRPRL